MNKQQTPRKRKAVRNVDTVKHCGLPIQSFMFSDGSVIRKCAFTYCTRFDAERQRVLAEPMKGAK